MNTKNIVPRPNHLQRLLEKFEKRKSSKRKDSSSQQNRMKNQQDKSMNRLLNGKIPPILVPEEAANLGKSATVKTLVPKLKIHALSPVKIDAKNSTQGTKRCLNTDLPSSLLLAL